jgi:hypothetical protein
MVFSVFWGRSNTLSADDCFPDLLHDDGSTSLFDAPTLLRWSGQSDNEATPDPDDPIATDRPDFTESSTTVGLGTLQLETGYTFTSDGSGVARVRSHSYPETLFRYGIVADWLEFRVGQNFASELNSGNSTHGAEDLYLGFKLALTRQSGMLPEVAIVPQLTVPTGSRAFSAGQSLPGVNLLYGWDLTENISTAGSTQFNRATDEATGHDYTEWAQSWTVGYSLTEQLGAYTEWYSFIPHSANSVDSQHYFNGGFSYQFTSNVQWDIRAGVGLNDAADDYFVGSGLSLRWK